MKLDILIVLAMACIFVCVRGPSRSPCGQPHCQGSYVGATETKTYDDKRNRWDKVGNGRHERGGVEMISILVMAKNESRLLYCEYLASPSAPGHARSRLWSQRETCGRPLQNGAKGKGGSWRDRHPRTLGGHRRPISGLYP